MISMNFNSCASFALFFIIPFIFCFVFEHETLYTIRVLAVFDFYNRPKACNLTGRENLQNLDCTFCFLFEDFRLCSRYNKVNYGAWHVYKPLFGSSVATCRLACSEILLLINEKSRKRSDSTTSRVSPYTSFVL